jgi:putative membrane protein
MEFLLHATITAVALVLVSKLLRGFEIDNWFTALLTAIILGLIYAALMPVAGQIGSMIGGLLAKTAFAYPTKLILLFISSLAINALVLRFVARIGPGFRISDFTTAMLAALLLVLFNGLFGELVAYLRNS